MIEDELEEFRSIVVQCVACFRDALTTYCKEANTEQLFDDIKKVRKLEGRADDIRREVEVLLYSQSLFPESRGDLLGLLESTDKIANRCESSDWVRRKISIATPVGEGNNPVALSSSKTYPLSRSRSVNANVLPTGMAAGITNSAFALS